MQNKTVSGILLFFTENVLLINPRIERLINVIKSLLILSVIVNDISPTLNFSVYQNWS